MNVKIEKLVYGGEGLGHHDGRTVFVPFVLPGEIVAVRPLEEKKKFVRGHPQQLLTASPERVAPPCPHFTVCGGCHYQHIPYATQLRTKAEILRETLWRIGRINWEGPIEVHASPPFGYRNRAQWKIRAIGDKAAAPGQLAIGYFQAGSTALCPVDECPILSPRLGEVLAALRGLCAQGALPAALREVEAFVDSTDNKVLLNASLSSFTVPPASLAEIFRTALPGVETVLLHDRSSDRFELDGPGFLRYAVAGTPYRVGHLSFFQVNRFLIEELVRAATTGASGGLALDLFAGVGLFTIPLARHFERVVAVEANPAAARDLEANIASSGVTAQSVNAEVDQFLTDVKETPELVLLDPPRAGVSTAALERLVALAPRQITYLSCDPATLARDLALLMGVAAGGARTAYALAEAHLFDVFPQSFHIESLVRLSRRE